MDVGICDGAGDCDGVVDVRVCRRWWADAGVCDSDGVSVGAGVVDVRVCRRWWVDVGVFDGDGVGVGDGVVGVGVCRPSAMMWWTSASAMMSLALRWCWR